MRPQLLSTPQSPVCEAEESRLTSVFRLILAATVFSHKPLSGIKTKPKYRNTADSIHVKQPPDLPTPLQEALRAPRVPGSLEMVGAWMPFL